MSIIFLITQKTNREKKKNKERKENEAKIWTSHFMFRSSGGGFISILNGYLFFYYFISTTNKILSTINNAR